MNWWKLALVITIAWLLVLTIFTFAMAHYIDTTPTNSQTDEIRSGKLGTAVGGLGLFGIAAIWGIAYQRRKRS